MNNDNDHDHDDGVNQKVRLDKMIILLAKSDSSDNNNNNDEYSLEIERKFKRSICTYFIQPIQFDFINIAELGELLSHPNQWSGIILTSKRCIDALMMSMEPSNNRHLLKVVQFFTVGTATRTYLLDKLSIDSKGYHTGNSEDLAKFIVEQYKTNDSNDHRPLLYPCSRIRTDPLMKILNENNISVHEIHCYNTLANQNLDDDFRKFKTFLSTLITSEMKIEIPIVFFSPSGVDNLCDHIQRYLHDNESNILLRYIAFGRQTAQRIESKNMNVWFTVSTPNPQSLADDLYRKIFDK